jgi:DNA-directed RNA polymerase specialized sigma24 family protein
MTPPTELRAWIVEAQRGDRGAFERAIAAVEDELRATIDRRLGRGLRPATDPEVVLQETRVRAFASRARVTSSIFDCER